MGNKLIIKSYLKERLGAVLIYAGIVLIFFSLAELYGYAQMAENMSYAVRLTAFFGILGGIADFIRYRGRCLKLIGIAAGKGERDYHLPEAFSLPERLYQEMIMALEAEKRGLVTEYDEKKRNMEDYYTMWIHQIKTPIAALRLLQESGEKAGNGGCPKGQAEELFKIEQYAEMALHYARLESLSADLVFKQYDVYALMKQAVKKYGVLFIGSGLSFSMEEFCARAVTDEKWLVFVLEQILSNAIKYTPEGKISVYGGDAAGRKMEGMVSYVVIEDTGIGIREEDLPRIFERGFTGYNGRMDKKSTGIGLYLCRQIMDWLSHTIRVESSVGTGTKVILGFKQQKCDKNVR